MVATRRTARKAAGTRRTAAKSAARILEVSFDGYEPPRGEYMGDDPRPGVYRFELQSVGAHMNKAGTNETIRWIFSCVDEPYAGWAGFIYTDIDPESEYFYKTQHNVRAVTGGVPKGSVKLNLDDPTAFIKAAKVVLGRVVMEENRQTGETRPSLSRVAPDDPNLVTGGEPADEDDDEYDELDDEVDEADEDVDDEGDEEDTDEEDDEDEEEDDDEEGDEEDEEDDEPEPEPAPAPKTRRRAAAKTAAAPAKKAARTRRR